MGEGLRLKYFVLKPRAKSRDDKYARASQAALAAYAGSIEKENADLALDLLSWKRKEEIRQDTMEPTDDR